MPKAASVERKRGDQVEPKPRPRISKQQQQQPPTPQPPPPCPTPPPPTSSTAAQRRKRSADKDSRRPAAEQKRPTTTTATTTSTTKQATVRCAHLLPLLLPPPVVTAARPQLAKAGFEVGKAGWSMSNVGNLDRTSNNPEGNEEGGARNETKLSPFYEGYNVRGLLDKWRELPARLTMSDWAFYVKTTRRRSQRTQVDRLVADVCSKVLSMRELLHYSLDSGAHCMLWLNSALSQRYIASMRKGSHIIGRIMCDAMLKDKQNMSNFLVEHQFKEWIECAPHVCLNEKNEEIKRNLQRICRHQYIGHYMGKCTDELSGNECPNFDYYFCECFRRHIFIPEFFTFSHYYLMEEFLKKYETDEEFKKTSWLAKPAYLCAGKGFFMIRDAREFRYFYLVRSDSCVRREGYVLQRYLTRPCTVNTFKVDCRMYLLITVTNGRRVSGFFHPGFVRTTAAPWTAKLEQKGKLSGNIFEHLTSTELFKIANTKVQGDSEEEEDEEKKQCIPFNDACEQMATGAKKVKKGEVENPLPFAGDEDGSGGNLSEKDFEKFHWRFKYMVEVLCSKLDHVVRDKTGTFQIFGLDILIDSDAKPWLLEVNSHVATEQVYDSSQCRVVSNVVTEAICLMCEMFQKSLQEELITIEIQQGDQRLSKLSRSQRMMTARSEQEALDKLQQVLNKTEISQRRPPIFMQNFFWWYDTPRYRWLKPWVLRKKRVHKQVPWYSRIFLGLTARNDAIRRKNFKADEVTAAHDAMDFYKHVFWREKLETDMRRFEAEKLSKRAEAFAGGGASAPGAGATSIGGGNNPENMKDPEQPTSTSNAAASAKLGFAELDDRASNSCNFDEDYELGGTEVRLYNMKSGGGGGTVSGGLSRAAEAAYNQRLPTAQEVLNSASAAGFGGSAAGGGGSKRRQRTRFVP